MKRVLHGDPPQDREIKDRYLWMPKELMADSEGSLEDQRFCIGLWKHHISTRQLSILAQVLVSSVSPTGVFAPA